MEKIILINCKPINHTILSNYIYLGTGGYGGAGGYPSGYGGYGQGYPGYASTGGKHDLLILIANIWAYIIYLR